MINFELHTLTKVYFGKNQHERVGEIAAGYGAKKLLMLYGGGSLERSGVLGAVRASLGSAGVAFEELGGVQANPTLEFARVVAQRLGECGADMILAVGGGSVLDTAKMAALAYANKADPWALLTGDAPAKEMLPLGCILTIAAAGSETSQHAVLTNMQTGLKRGMGHDLLRPLFAIMNPELTYTLPPYQTACGIVDIMMHTLERYIDLSGTPNDLLDRTSEALVKAVVAAGSVAMQTADDYEARATLMLGGSWSHNNMMGAGKEYVMIAHQLEHELSGIDDSVAHGAGLAVVWPAYLRYVYLCDVPRFAKMAVRVWNCEMDFDHPEKTALAGIEACEAYFKSIGMPSRISEFGIGEGQVELMADKCTNYGARALKSVKGPLGKEDIMAIYRLCL